MNVTLHWHANLGHSVIVDTDAGTWIVPDVMHGWEQRRPYRGHRASLREMSPETQRLAWRKVGPREATE